ncbi:MAG: murein L,D-transpeptidase catalytic domain family protein [Gammaproteobacteria bacterium]
MLNNIRRFIHISSLVIGLFLTSFYVFAAPKPSPANINAEAESLEKIAPNLDINVLKLALKAYNHVDEKGLNKKHILTVIDYRLPSSQKRLWVFDLDQNKLLFNTYVAHGKNSGNLYAKHFSNAHQSKETSIGTFVTGNVFQSGHDGAALQINGLDKGFNDQAASRGVIMHGASYVSESFLKHNGRMGRSWGCPAVSKKIIEPIINTIKGKSVMFSYYPDTKWLSSSQYLS